MSRTRIFMMSTPIVLMMVGGAVQFGRPLPAVQVALTQPRLTVPGALKPAFPAQGQSALGEVGLGVVAETPNQEPVAIASLAKMMTAYVLLEARPLQVGDEGPVTTVTAADVEEYKRARADGHSVVKVREGDKLTQRQLLEALMLPSGNNIATMIAREVAGSEDTFVLRMNEAARALGMTQSTYADASGFKPMTVSTAHDQLLLAQALMLKHRVFREVVAMPQTTLPTAGTLYNVNFMVGKQGISGIKTGSTLAAGSCFVGSYPMMVEGQLRVVLAAVLGQPSLQEAITKNAALLQAAAPQFRTYTLDVPRGGVAQLTSAWNEQAPLSLTEPMRIFGYPGMPVALESRLAPVPLPILAGQPVAELTLTAGRARNTVKLRADGPIQGPSPLWRLFH